MPPLGPGEFDRLLRQALPMAGRLAVRLCGDPDEAEDVLGEAMLRALRARETFRGESAFSTWLYAIVVNAFRERLRRRRPAAPAAEMPEPADPSPSSAQRLAGEELSRHVAACVSALPPRQREALVLTAYEQMTAQEAARVLETTPQNVRVLLHHARATLRERLAPYLAADLRR